MRIKVEHDADCPLGENGLRAYWEAADTLACTPPEARATEQDREALHLAEHELEARQVCNCGAVAICAAALAALATLQKDCIHQVVNEPINGYRYRCIRCGKRLKILSGILLEAPPAGDSKP